MSVKAVERLYKLRVDASQATAQLNKISKNTNSLAKGFSRLQRIAGSALGVMASFRGIAGIVTASDQLNLLEGSFKALTGSGERAAGMLQDAFDTVSETGANLGDVSTTFQRLTVGLEELGATNSQIDTVANTFIKLGRVSGTSMFDTNAALVQFSQGLASGRLQGDELRSIMERLPLIINLIRDEWNRVNKSTQISRGDVKELGREGKLSAELITNALINGAKLTAEQFASLTFTLEQEQNRMGAAFKRLLKSVSDLTGVDDAVKDGIHALSDAIDNAAKNLSLFASDLKAAWKSSEWLQGAVVTLGAAITMKLVAAMYKLITASKILTRTNVFLLLATAAATAIPLIISHWDKLGIYFKYRVPAAWEGLKETVYGVLSKIEIGVKNAFGEIGNSIIKGINFAINKLNTAIISFNLITPGRDMHEGVVKLVDAFGDAGDSVSTLSILEGLAHWKRMRYERLYGEALARNANLKKDTAGGVDESNVGDKTIKDLRKFTTVVDPLLAVEATLRRIKIAVEEGMLTAKQADIISNMHIDTVDPLHKMNEAWEELSDTVRDAFDPFAKMEDLFRRLDIAVEMGDISSSSAEAFKKMSLDAAEAKDKIKGIVEEIKDAINGFARDFTNELVDSLRTGELKFKEFAASVLETIAKIVLNKIFEQFFNMIVGALPGFGGGSGVTAGSGGGGGGPIGFARASTAAQPRMNVGILGSSRYGYGSSAAAAGPGGVIVNIQNNAPVEVAVQQRETSGGIKIDMIIQEKVNKAIASGGLDKTLNASYGLRRRAF